MTTTRRKNPTKAQATKVLNAVKRQCHVSRDDAAKGYGPKLVENWDWFGTGEPPRWSILWEEGPYQWTYLFPYGGIEEEFGFRRADVSDAIPEGFFAEAQTSWAISLYEV